MDKWLHLLYSVMQLLIQSQNSTLQLLLSILKPSDSDLFQKGNPVLRMGEAHFLHIGMADQELKHGQKILRKIF